MTLLPVADGARLLGIHPKTLRHWLTTAHLPLVPHPTDARIRCVAQEALLEMASLHRCPLPDLSAGATLEQDTVAGEQQRRLTVPLLFLWSTCSSSFPSCTPSSRPSSTTSPVSRWQSCTSRPMGQALLPPPLHQHLGQPLACCLWRYERVPV